MIASADRLVQRLVEVGLQAVALAVDDAPLQPLVQRQREQLLGPGGPAGRGVAPSNSSRNRYSGSYPSRRRS